MTEFEELTLLKIRTRLNGKGLPASRMAKEAGVDIRALKKVMEGHEGSKHSAKTIYRLAKYLNIEL